MTTGPDTPALDARAEIAVRAENWIEWKGGFCPVPLDTPVLVRLRKGELWSDKPAPASNYDWGHVDSDGCQSPWDIVAYCVVEPVEQARAASRALASAPAPGDVEIAHQPLRFTYRNWRGEVSERRIWPGVLRYGSTEWHPEPQWVLSGFDIDKGETRVFAIRDMNFAAPSQSEAERREAYRQIGKQLRDEARVAGSTLGHINQANRLVDLADQIDAIAARGAPAGPIGDGAGDDALIRELEGYAEEARVGAYDGLHDALVRTIAILRATPPASAGEPTEALTPEEAWRDLVEKDDRNSPEEYPDMALITFEELQGYMRAGRVG